MVWFDFLHCLKCVTLKRLSTSQLGVVGEQVTHCGACNLIKTLVWCSSVEQSGTCSAIPSGLRRLLVKISICKFLIFGREWVKRGRRRIG